MLYNKQTIAKIELVKKFIERKLNIRLLRSVYEESAMRFILFFDTENWHKLNFYDNENDREEYVNLMSALRYGVDNITLATTKDPLLFELLREEEILKRKLDTYYSFELGKGIGKIPITDYQIRRIMWEIKVHDLRFNYDKKLYGIKQIKATYDVEELTEPIRDGNSGVYYVENNHIHSVTLMLQDDYTINLTTEAGDTNTLFIKLSKKLLYENF